MVYSAKISLKETMDSLYRVLASVTTGFDSWETSRHSGIGGDEARIGDTTSEGRSVVDGSAEAVGVDRTSDVAVPSVGPLAGDFDFDFLNRQPLERRFEKLLILACLGLLEG